MDSRKKLYFGFMSFFACCFWIIIPVFASVERNQSGNNWNDSGNVQLMANRNKDVEDIDGEEDRTFRIRQEWDRVECCQGDSVVLSVYLISDENFESETISAIEGILKYDKKIFAVQSKDMIPVQTKKVQNKAIEADGKSFSVYYNSDISVSNGSLLFKIKFNALKDSDIGNTELGIAHLEFYEIESDDVFSIEDQQLQIIKITEGDISSDHVLLGDVNLDKKINLTDVKYVMQYYNGKRNLNTNQCKNADVNKDGNVNLTDAKLILKYYNKEISYF